MTPPAPPEGGDDRPGRLRGLVPLVAILGGLALSFAALGLAAKGHGGIADASVAVGLSGVGVGLVALIRT